MDYKSQFFELYEVLTHDILLLWIVPYKTILNKITSEDLDIY